MDDKKNNSEYMGFPIEKKYEFIYFPIAGVIALVFYLKIKPNLSIHIDKIDLLDFSFAALLFGSLGLLTSNVSAYIFSLNPFLPSITPKYYRRFGTILIFFGIFLFCVFLWGK